MFSAVLLIDFTCSCTSGAGVSSGVSSGVSGGFRSPPAFAVVRETALKCPVISASHLSLSY